MRELSKRTAIDNVSVELRLATLSTHIGLIDLIDLIDVQISTIVTTQTLPNGMMFIMLIIVLDLINDTVAIEPTKCKGGEI